MSKHRRTETFCVAARQANMDADELAVFAGLGAAEYACSRCGATVIISPASVANNARLRAAGTFVALVRFDCVSGGEVRRGRIMLAPGAGAELRAAWSGLALRRRRN